MTLETVNKVDQQLAASFLKMTTAHDALTIPETDDVAVDWRQVLVEIDEYGEAVMALVELARDELLPHLKVVKLQVQATLAEIDTLNRSLAQASPSA